MERWLNQTCLRCYFIPLLSLLLEYHGQFLPRSGIALCISGNLTQALQWTAVLPATQSYFMRMWLCFWSAVYNSTCWTGHISGISSFLQIRFPAYLINPSLLGWLGLNCWWKYSISIVPLEIITSFVVAKLKSVCTNVELRAIKMLTGLQKKTPAVFCFSLCSLFTSYSKTKWCDI